MSQPVGHPRNVAAGGAGDTAMRAPPSRRNTGRPAALSLRSYSAMSMSPIAAMICGRWLRGNGAGKLSETPMPPWRGEVSENTFCQISVWPSGSMPAATSAKARTRSQICFCGPPAISPKPTRCGPRPAQTGCAPCVHARSNAAGRSAPTTDERGLR
jgi:hypothetical protein